MGLWDYVSSTANSINQYTIKPVHKLCSYSFSYGWAAAAKICNDIGGTNAVQRLNMHLQDEDARSKMSQFANDCARNATVFAFREGVKAFPGGGPIWDIVSRSLPNNKKLKNHKKEQIMELKSVLEDHKEQIKELQAKIDKMGKECENQNFVYQEEVQELDTNVDLECRIQEVNRNQAATIRTLIAKGVHSTVNKQPEDVIQEMMMKGFIASCSFSDYLSKLKEHPKSEQ